MVIIIFALYLLYVKSGKHMGISKTYEGETHQQKMTGKKFAIGYFVLSIELVIFSFYLMLLKNRGEL